MIETWSHIVSIMISFILLSYLELKRAMKEEVEFSASDTDDLFCYHHFKYFSVYLIAYYKDSLSLEG